MGSKVNPNHELRCYSAARPYVELFPPHASCGMYNVSQASSATGFIRPVHTHCIDSTLPINTSVIFLTHSVNVRRRRWYFWLALSFSTECKCKPCHSFGRLHHSRLFDQDLGFWISSIWKSKSINTERVEMLDSITASLFVWNWLSWQIVQYQMTRSK